MQVRNYVPIIASAIGGFEGPRSETTGPVGELQAPLDFECVSENGARACPVADGGESDEEVAEIIEEDDDLPIPDAVEAFDLGIPSTNEAHVRPPSRPRPSRRLTPAGWTNHNLTHFP